MKGLTNGTSSTNKPNRKWSGVDPDPGHGGETQRSRDRNQESVKPDPSHGRDEDLEDKRCCSILALEHVREHVVEEHAKEHNHRSKIAAARELRSKKKTDWQSSLETTKESHAGIDEREEGDPNLTS